MFSLCGKLHADKKAFLCTLFVVQVCLIGGVLLFSTLSTSGDTTTNALQPVSAGAAARATDNRFDDPVPVVEFVRRNSTRNSADGSGHVNEDVRIVTSGRYDNEFVGRQHCFRVCMAIRVRHIRRIKHSQCSSLLQHTRTHRTVWLDDRFPMTLPIDTAKRASARRTTTAAIAANRRCCGVPS